MLFLQCNSILGNSNHYRAAESSSLQLPLLINIQFPVLYLAYWISRHCVLLYGKIEY